MDKDYQNKILSLIQVFKESYIPHITSIMNGIENNTTTKSIERHYFKSIAALENILVRTKKALLEKEFFSKKKQKICSLEEINCYMVYTILT